MFSDRESSFYTTVTERKERGGWEKFGLLAMVTRRIFNSSNFLAMFTSRNSTLRCQLSSVNITAVSFHLSVPYVHQAERPPRQAYEEAGRKTPRSAQSCCSYVMCLDIEPPWGLGFLLNTGGKERKTSQVLTKTENTQVRNVPWNMPHEQEGMQT